MTESQRNDGRVNAVTGEGRLGLTARGRGNTRAPDPLPP